MAIPLTVSFQESCSFSFVFKVEGHEFLHAIPLKLKNLTFPSLFSPPNLFYQIVFPFFVVFIWIFFPFVSIRLGMFGILTFLFKETGFLFYKSVPLNFFFYFINFYFLATCISILFTLNLHFFSYL